jgi:hypothetical protein
MRQALRELRALRQPAFIWGPPGVGKSDVVGQLAEEDRLQLIDFRMALRDPTDVKGFPIPDLKAGSMRFLRDAELPTSGEGILFMDELNSALPATQAAGMQLSLPPFRIGDYQLPPGWTIVAAGNRETDRGVVNRMPSPLANRFVHIDYDVHLDDWCEWALNHSVSSEMVGFIRFRPALLHAPDYTQRAFATPRTIVIADRLHRRALPADMEYELIKGTIGEGPAGELSAYLAVAAELPTFDDIIKAPTATRVPPSTSTGVLFALATMLGSRSVKKNFEAVMAYVTRLPVEFQILAVRDALRATPDVAETKSYIHWGIANAAVTL